MEKIGVWNFVINLIGSLVVLGILVFLSIRENMSNFTGLGTNLNSHVICVKPQVKDVTLFNGAEEEQTDHSYLRGSVSIGQELLQASRSSITQGSRQARSTGSTSFVFWPLQGPITMISQYSCA
jgi:hypothetical protein